MSPSSTRRHGARAWTSRRPGGRASLIPWRLKADSLAADGRHSGALRGGLTATLDGHGGCLSRLRLKGRSTGVGWRSGARRGS